MQAHKYCDMCDKSKRRTKDPWQKFRYAEGYLVLRIENGVEITKECPKCKGTGLLFVKDIEVTEMDRSNYADGD